MAMMTTNYRSRPMNHSMMMMLMLSAQTPSQSLKMGHNQTIPALHPRMIGPSSLRLHPLLCPFPQKSSCKINLHHPTTPPLKTLLAINLLPNQTNPRPSPKEKVSATTT